jgi:outer membrane protein W
MKILLKLLSIVVVLTLSAESYAQIIGVKGGLNLSNMIMKDDESTYSDDFKMTPGFHVGPTAEFPISDMLSFETGLLLSTKGFKMEESGDGYEYSGNFNLFYVDVPLTVKAAYDVGSFKVYGAVGPYVGVGVSGKTKYKITYGGESQTDTEVVEWGSDPDTDDLKRLDYGAVVGAGVEINAIQIGATYGLGLANISPDTDGGNKISHRVIQVSVGFKFGGK